MAPNVLSKIGINIKVSLRYWQYIFFNLKMFLMSCRHLTFSAVLQSADWGTERFTNYNQVPICQSLVKVFFTQFTQIKNHTTHQTQQINDTSNESLNQISYLDQERCTTVHKYYWNPSVQGKQIGCKQEVNCMCIYLSNYYAFFVMFSWNYIYKNKIKIMRCRIRKYLLLLCDTHLGLIYISLFSINR